MSGGSPRNRAAKGERDEPTAAASVAIVTSPIKGASDETHNPGGGAFAGRRAGGGGAAQIDNESGLAAVASIRAGRILHGIRRRDQRPRRVNVPERRDLGGRANPRLRRPRLLPDTSWKNVAAAVPKP